MQAVQVVIQTAFLGDLILTIPFLRRIKFLRPDLKTVLICKEGLSSFLIQHQEIDMALEIKKGDRRSYAEILKQLKNYHVENVFCVHRSLRSQLFAWQIKSKQKIGYKSVISGMVFNKSYSYPQAWPDAIQKFQLLVDLDPEVQLNLKNSQELCQLNLSSPDGELPKIPTFFSFQKQDPPLITSNPIQNSKTICIFPGSVWATKKWTESGFREVADYFSNKNYKVLLMGSKDEFQLCQSVAEGLKNTEVLAGQLSIFESIERLRHSHLVIANDSAATHMAAFANTPSITLFGPTTLDLGFRPWNNESLVVENKSLKCRPCGAHGPMVCPLGHHHCMKLTSSKQVIEKAEVLIKEN